MDSVQEYALVLEKYLPSLADLGEGTIMLMLEPNGEAEKPTQILDRKIYRPDYLVVDTEEKPTKSNFFDSVEKEAAYQREVEYYNRHL